jgi:type I restriction enzyme R subunit/putative DNA methylase
MTPPQTRREYLRDLVAQKNQWSRTLTAEEKALGFPGWHERGHLPHCDFSGLVQFVTFRLADSMPASRRREWEHLLVIEDVRSRRAQLEDYLDRGFGECRLREATVAQLAIDSLLHFHNQRYELLSWCIMPNHLHVLVHVWQTPLWKIIKSWKQHIATKAQAILSERRPPARHEQKKKPPGRRPALQSLRWEREYWDTYMRNEEQERKVRRYIESNPVRAGLCATPRDWPFASARLRDEYEELQLLDGSAAVRAGTK